jgi:transcriptional regulator with XRE-family HTH domain
LAGVDIRARLAKNIRRLRQEKGWSQEELAHEARIHCTYISDLERGVRNPTITIIKRLAQTLGVEARELI